MAIEGIYFRTFCLNTKSTAKKSRTKDAPYTRAYPRPPFVQATALELRHDKQVST